MSTNKNVIRWLTLCGLVLAATVAWADQGTRTVSIPAGSQTFLPPLTRGDNEFKGHGPKINAKFRVYVSGDRKQVLAKIYMKAEEWDTSEDEEKSDFTTAEGWSKAFPLHNVTERGWEIVWFRRPGVFGPTREVAETYGYIDDDEEVDDFSGTRAVEMWYFTGDVQGDDAHPLGLQEEHLEDDTRVRVEYPAFQVNERRTAGWYGFQNSRNVDREAELRSRCAPSFTRVNVAKGTTFSALCASIGLRCFKVCDWDGKIKSCADSPYSWGDGSRIAYCR